MTWLAVLPRGTQKLRQNYAATFSSLYACGTTLLIESDDRGEWSSCTSEERSLCEDICASGRQLQRERFPSILGGVKGLGSVRRVSNIFETCCAFGSAEVEANLKTRNTVMATLCGILVAVSISPNHLKAQASAGPLAPPAQSQTPHNQSTAKPKQQEIQPRTSLEGAWKLNRDESDDPRAKAQDSRGTSGGNGGGYPGGGYPGGGYPGGGGRYPGGGYPGGGYPGGGYPGGGRPRGV